MDILTGSNLQIFIQLRDILEKVRHLDLSILTASNNFQFYSLLLINFDDKIYDFCFTNNQKSLI